VSRQKVLRTEPHHDDALQAASLKAMTSPANRDVTWPSVPGVVVAIVLGAIFFESSRNHPTRRPRARSPWPLPT
jgi:hypothetical protein